MAKKSRTATVKQEVTTEAQIDLAKLGEIAKATIAGGFIYASANEVAPLVAAELVETNAAMTDESGNIATRATTKGIETMDANTATATADAPAAPAAAPVAATRPARGSFTIRTEVPVPTIQRGGRGGNVYPFDQLPVNGSFHIAATDAKPNPAKSLASTVSSASKRYEDAHKESNGAIPSRKFIVRSVGDNDPDGKGARIFRVE
jgi:hypothetical protein